MIQRIQTVYLLLAVAALVGTLFLPIGVLVQPESATHICITPLGTEEFRPLGYAGILILSALLALSTVLLWKNRPLQLRLSVFNLMIMLLSYLVYFIYRMVQTDAVQFTFGIATVLPFVAIVCTILAMRGIRRDEKLIRSMDRIR